MSHVTHMNHVTHINTSHINTPQQCHAYVPHNNVAHTRYFTHINTPSSAHTPSLMSYPWGCPERPCVSALTACHTDPNSNSFSCSIIFIYIRHIFVMSHISTHNLQKRVMSHTSIYHLRTIFMSHISTYGVATISRLLTMLVSFAKESRKRGCILQKKPMIVRSLLIVDTPYHLQMISMSHVSTYHLQNIVSFIGFFCKRDL